MDSQLKNEWVFFPEISKVILIFRWNSLNNSERIQLENSHFSDLHTNKAILLKTVFTIFLIAKMC